jgi:hypothetical protein
VVKVNLLSPGSTKEKNERVTKLVFKIIAVLAILAGIFLACGILLSLVNIYRSNRLPLINKEYEQAESFAKRIVELRKEKEILKEKLDFVERYLKRDILWSQKLAQLRKIIPNEVWLRQFYSEKTEIKDSVSTKLYLRGGLTGRPDATALEVLSLLVEQLQKDKDFSLNMGNPILTESRKDIYNSLEILTFSIEIPIKTKI